MILDVTVKAPWRALSGLFRDRPMHRHRLGDWLNHHGLTGTMVEVGVANGGFARKVLESWGGKQYVMVDPWIAQEGIYTEGVSYPYGEWLNQCEQIAREDQRVQLLRLFSEQAAITFPDGSLDCCYIDGNHEFPSVLTDLSMWWPKVKSGGLLCGHDFYNLANGAHNCQVKEALMVWGWTLPAPPRLSVSACSSWWLVKP